LANDAPVFFRILASLQPRLKIQEIREFEGTIDLNEVSTRDLLRSLNLTSVEQAEVLGEADEQ